MQCVQALSLWCDNSSVINNHMFKGYKGGNKRRRSNEFLAGSLVSIQNFLSNCPNRLYPTILISQAIIPVGYDFLDTNKRRFHIYVWYNSSFSRDNGHHSMTVLRVSRLVNMVLTLAYRFFFSQLFQ
jgi:hypothetical protein